MESNARSRITLFPLRSTIYGIQGLGGLPPLPAYWVPVADIARGDETGGVLVRHTRTGLHALWTGVGSIESVPEHKVRRALANLH